MKAKIPPPENVTNKQKDKIYNGIDSLPKTVRHRMKGRSLDEDGDDEDHHDHLDQGCFGATK